MTQIVGTIVLLVILALPVLAGNVGHRPHTPKLPTPHKPRITIHRDLTWQKER